MFSPPSAPVQIRTFGVGIKAVTSEQNHVVAYFWDDEVRQCHFAWHKDLRIETPTAGYYWSECGFEPINARIAAAQFKAISIDENLAVIPYGFDAAENAFDPLTGAYRHQEVGRGLTCATFILNVLGCVGISPLSVGGYQGLPDDQAWQDGMIELLRHSGAEEEHVQAISRNPQSVRIRPEHVAVGIQAADGPLVPPVFVPRGTALHSEIRQKSI